jgi:phosphoribosylpyrophosphate synthetase
MPLLFTFSDYSQTNAFLCDLPGLKPGQFSITRYDNQELRVTIQSRVTDSHCFILGSVTPPECQVVSFLLLAHTLKKEAQVESPESSLTLPTLGRTS